MQNNDIHDLSMAKEQSRFDFSKYRHSSRGPIANDELDYLLIVGPVHASSVDC